MMGYLKGLPSDLVMTFGSGTGLSGFTGVLTVLFLNALGLSQGKVSLVLHYIELPPTWACRDPLLSVLRLA
jgi:hypothetical protein